MQDFPSFIQLSNVFREPTLIQVFRGMGFLSTFVCDCDLQASIQEGGLADSSVHLLIVEINNFCEDRAIGLE